MNTRVVLVLMSRGLSAIMQAVVLVLLARGLGPAHFGQYSLIVAVSGFAAVILAFGTGTLALRASSLEDPETAARGVLTLRTTVYIPALTGTAFLLIFLGYEPLVAVAACVSVLLETTSQAQESLLFGQNRPRAAQGIMLVRRAIVFIGVGCAYLLGVQILSAYIASSAFAMLLLFGYAGGRAISLRSLLPTLREARRYWLPSVLAKLESLDVVIASWGMGTTGLGIYAGASRVTTPLQLLPSALLSVYTPALSMEPNDIARRRLVKRASTFVLMALGPVVLFAPLLGKIVEWMLGYEYDGVGRPVVALIVAVFVGSFSQIFISYFYGRGVPEPVRNARLVSVPVGLAAVAVGSSVWGPIGAASGTVVLNATALVLLYVVYRRSR